MLSLLELERDVDDGHQSLVIRQDYIVASGSTSSFPMVARRAQGTTETTLESLAPTPPMNQGTRQLDGRRGVG